MYALSTKRLRRALSGRDVSVWPDEEMYVGFWAGFEDGCCDGVFEGLSDIFAMFVDCKVMAAERL